MSCYRNFIRYQLQQDRNVSDVEQPSETQILGPTVYSGFSSAMISGKHRLSSQDEHLGSRNSVREDV